ncbi:MAG: hypothetical protein J7J98_08650 [candidate division Zixibacteria bacterium]|nr:hypothetical protein [candidate division Zixibacteria bacterium]
MFGSRLFLITAFLSFVLVGSVLGDNQIRVYVPANEYHAEQELVVGQAGEIYVEVTCDVELVTVTVSLEVANPGGATRLWSPITNSDVEWLLPEDALDMRSFSESHQSGNWPDSLHCWALKLMSPSLASGTYQFIKMTVMPTAAGTVVLSDALVATHWCEFHDGTTLFSPELVLPNITVIQLDDCNENGIPDVQELAEGTALDCNSNGFPDECDITWGTELDCNLNGVPDACDLSDGTSGDCNSNLIPDECDPDLNFNGVPDDCESEADCNFNGIPDVDDILSGWSNDSNGNYVPDECEGLAGNYVRIYAPPDEYHSSQEIELFKPGRIVMAIVNDVAIDAVAVPFRFNSLDGTPLWAPFAEEDVVFITPKDPSDYRHIYFRQGGDWPDSLTVLQAFFEGEALPVGCHPFVEMTAVPTELGTISWELAPVPTALTPASYLVSGSSEEILIDLVAEDINIIEPDDCNNNGILDIEELAAGTALDCNDNGRLDECDILFGVSGDCNSNGVPDECDYDLNLNGIPDDCEDFIDCNFNGIPDEDDIAWGNSTDNNANGVPDECEGLVGNYFQIYVPPGQELYLNRPADIIVAVVSDLPIVGYALPFRYLSGDGTPLWEPVTLDDVTFFDPTDFSTFIFDRQEGDWPDSLVVFEPHVNGESMPAGFHPVCRITVTPTLTGTATFGAAPIPPTLSPVSFIPVGVYDLEVPVIASPVTVLSSCCVGVVGNVNMIGGDEPTIGDVALLIDHLFMSGVPLDCLPEADVNQSGGANPTYGDITIGDVSALIDYLFLSGGTLPECL